MMTVLMLEGLLLELRSGVIEQVRVIKMALVLFLA